MHEHSEYNEAFDKLFIKQTAIPDIPDFSQWVETRIWLIPDYPVNHLTKHKVKLEKCVNLLTGAYVIYFIGHGKLYKAQTLSNTE